ncbi:hypothetical protein IWQ57_003660, partial [Coemansia nantahalensis]
AARRHAAVPPVGQQRPQEDVVEEYEVEDLHRRRHRCHHPRHCPVRCPEQEV